MLTLSTCTRKLMFRWSLLGLSLGLAVHLVLWLTSGELFVTDVLLLTYDSPVSLPSVPRLVDVLVALMPLSLIVAMCKESKQIGLRWGPPRVRDYCEPKPRDAYGVITVGLLLGICGSLLIAALGVAGAAIGTAVCSAVILFVAREAERVRWNFSIDIIACIAIWLLNTLYQGAIAGLAYALVALGVAAIVHFGGSFLINLVKAFFGGPFRRTMLTCEVDNQHC